MLKGISPLFSPELLSAVYRMGHGDELVLADAHFPGDSVSKRVIRADGVSVTDLLEAILPLFELDAYVEDPVLMMSAVEGDSLDPGVVEDYYSVISRYAPAYAKVHNIERHAFYKRAEEAFVVVLTGETRKYGNIILKKGVTPV